MASSWSSFWSTVQSATGIGPFLQLLSFIGVGMLIFSLVTWLFALRRSGSFKANADHHKLILGIIIGAVLAAPSVLVPAFLSLFDVIINFIIGLLPSL